MCLRRLAPHLFTPANLKHYPPQSEPVWGGLLLKMFRAPQNHGKRQSETTLRSSCSNQRCTYKEILGKILEPIPMQNASGGGEAQVGALHGSGDLPPSDIPQS